LIPCRPRAAEGGWKERERRPWRKERRRQGRDKAEKEEEQRIKGIRTSQGLMRNFRKLQGLACKAKFSINIKPE
jgi:hypothetical protein